MDKLKALFGWQNEKFSNTVALLFVYDKYCSIMD